MSEKPKPKTNAWKPSGPPGLAPPIVTSKTRFADEETEVSWPEVNALTVSTEPKDSRPKMPKANFCSKSQAKKKAKEENELMGSLIKRTSRSAPRWRRSTRS